MNYIPVKPKQNIAIASKTEDRTSDNAFRVLKINSANECLQNAMNKPIPKKLFGEIWCEGELCILFADTNLGKSLLSVQVAHSISSGNSTLGLRLEAPKQKVLYFDFEINDKQFEKRYSEDFKNHFKFDDNFLRVEINQDSDDLESFETAFFSDLEKAIIQNNAKILIVDNITYLSAHSNETAKEALPMMKLLKVLKTKYDLSILVLAHTPKRNQYNPITKNDLAGSKMLSNFSDSMFCIGLSHKDKGLRYIKQIKTRDDEMLYDSNNVILCEIKKDINFVGFSFLGYSYEKEHLKELDPDEISELESAIVNLKNSKPDISDREIAKELKTYPMKVCRVLKKNSKQSI